MPGAGYWDSNGDYVNGGIQRTMLMGSKVPLGVGANIVSNVTTLSASTERTILNIPQGKAVEIVDISYSFYAANENFLGLKIYAIGSDGVERVMGKVNGSTVSDSLSIASLIARKELNTTAAIGTGWNTSYSAKDWKILLPNGGRIAQINSDTVSKSCAISIQYREVN